MRQFPHSPAARRALFLCSAGLILAATAAAQRAASSAPLGRAAQTPACSAAADDEDLSTSARRILHFANGGTLRAVARFQDDRWQVKDRAEWITLPAGSVLRAPREAEVLRERKRRARDLERSGDLDARVSFAAWMVDEGLLREALLELDRVLDASPHHPGALGLLKRERILAVPSLEVPATQREDALGNLLEWAAGQPTSGRELAILELATLEDREALHADLMQELSSFSLRRRSFASHALGRLFPGQEVKRLLQHAVLDSSSEVRRDAAQALHNSDEPALIVPVVRALNSRNPRVRTQAAEALGYLGYPAAVEPLMSYLTAASTRSASGSPVNHGYIFVGRQTAYIQDFDVEVATFQAVADPQINVLLEGDVLEAGVIGVVEYSFAAESRAARGSLGRLTGANPGRTAKAWKRWWEEHAEEWKQKPVASATKTAGS